MGFEKYGVERKECKICGELLEPAEEKKNRGLCQSCHEREITPEKDYK